MKLFAVGDYDEFTSYYIVMAESKEDVIKKVLNLKIGDLIGVNNNTYVDKSYSDDIIASISRIEEIPSGIYPTENA